MGAETPSRSLAATHRRRRAHPMIDDRRSAIHNSACAHHDGCWHRSRAVTGVGASTALVRRRGDRNHNPAGTLDERLHQGRDLGGDRTARISLRMDAPQRHLGLLERSGGDVPRWRTQMPFASTGPLRSGWAAGGLPHAHELPAASRLRASWRARRSEVSRSATTPSRVAVRRADRTGSMLLSDTLGGDGGAVSDTLGGDGLAGARQPTTGWW